MGIACGIAGNSSCWIITLCTIRSFPKYNQDEIDSIRASVQWADASFCGSSSLFSGRKLHTDILTWYDTIPKLHSFCSSFDYFLGAFEHVFHPFPKLKVKLKKTPTPKEQLKRKNSQICQKDFEMKVENCNKVIILASWTPLDFSHLWPVTVTTAGSRPSPSTAGFHVSQVAAIQLPSLTPMTSQPVSRVFLLPFPTISNYSNYFPIIN